MTTSKISPALKHLLSVNAHPANLQTVSFQPQLNRLLSDFRQTASSKSLTSDSWTIFSTAALVSLNRPSAFEPFWLSLKSDEDRFDPLYAANLIRETGLKSISFIGIAKSINALNSFRSVLDRHDPNLTLNLDSQHKPRRIPNSDENSIENVFKRASKTWESIYRPLDQKLIAKLSLAHPDLPVHILHSHYGPLLSDPSHDPGPVGRIGTSLIAIGTLRAAGQLGPQLLSHVYGLRKAGEELAESGEPSLGQGTQWLTSDAGAEWVISGIDQLVRLVLNSESEHQPDSKL